MQIHLSLSFSRDVEKDDFFWLPRESQSYFHRFFRASMNSSTFTFKAPGRNHIVLTAFETIAKALLCWNSAVLLFRSSSKMFYHRERFEKHSLSITDTKRECTRRHEASSTLRAAQVSRQGLLKSTSGPILFPKCRINVAGAWCCQPG